MSPHGFDKSKGFLQIAALDQQIDNVESRISQHSHKAEEPAADDKRCGHNKFDHDVLFYVDGNMLCQQKFAEDAAENEDNKGG